MAASRTAPADRPARRPAGRPSPLRAALEAAAAIGLGGVLGSGLSVLGSRLLPDGPLLGPVLRTASVGLEPPLRVDLGVGTFTFGLTVRLSLLTLLCAVGAAVLWRRARR